MRSTFRMIVPLLVIMGLFVVIVVILARVARLDYGYLASRLYHLKHDHAILANAVLSVRQGNQHETISTIVAAKNRIAGGAEQLKELNLRRQTSDAELKTLIDQYSQTVVELTDHVEHFKSANAIEYNSLHYLPQLTASIKDLTETSGTEIPRTVDQLLWALSVHLIDETPDSREQVEGRINSLGDMKAKLPAQVVRQLDSLVGHVKKILEMRPLVTTHLDAIVTSPADQFLTQASLAVAEKNDYTLDRQQTLQLALVVIGAMLVGYVGALLWMLRLSVRELDEANQALEETVEKRVAELKLKNQQLFQAQKLESIGQLAAGIAHEINTPMQFVYDNLEFLSECSDTLFGVVDAYERNLTAEGPSRPWQERSSEVQQISKVAHFEHLRTETPKAIRESLEGIQRVIHIVRAMKEFSHPGQEAKVGVDLNNAVHTTATMTRNRWKHIADLELDLDPNLPTLHCVPAEINQLLLNLVVNAADAILDKLGASSDEKGAITVRTSHNSEQVIVEIADTGCGIPTEIRNRIFDPFFTTKDPGKGTGQGLAICYNIIVNKLQGSIDLDSTPGVGTRFTLMIPLPDGGESPDAMEPISDLELELVS